MDDISPYDAPDGELGSWQAANARLAQGAVGMASGEDDPKKAARAVQLESVTGVPAAAIYPATDEFEDQHKAVLSSDLVATNRFLQDYMSSHPLAAKISRDEIPQLDEASQTFQDLQFPNIDPLLDKFFGNVAAGAERGFGQSKAQELVASGESEGHRLGTAVIGGLSNLYEIPMRPLMAGIFGAAYGVLGPDKGDDLAQALTDPATLVSLQGLGPQGAMAAGFVRAFQIATPFLRAGKPIPTGISAAVDTVHKVVAQEQIKNLDEAVKTMGKVPSLAEEGTTQFHADNFVAPHTGDSVVRIRADAVARLYGEDIPEPGDGKLGWVPNLSASMEALKDSNGYITVPRSDFIAQMAKEPDTYKALREDVLIGQHGFTLNESKLVKDWKPEVAEEPKPAVDGEPAPRPKSTSSEYIIDNPIQATDADPETQRVRVIKSGDSTALMLLDRGSHMIDVSNMAKAGMSDEEMIARSLGDHTDPNKPDVGKVRKQTQPALDTGTRVIDNPTTIVNGAAGLEPMFSVGNRKLTLQRMAQAEGKEQPAWMKDAAFHFHDFDLLDENGGKVGSINLSELKDGKQLYIEMIQGGPKEKGFYDPNFFGPALVRDIYRQLKKEFPVAFGPDGEGLTGHRVSGAREKAGSWELDSAMPKVKFKLGGDAGEIQSFRDLLSQMGDGGNPTNLHEALTQMDLSGLTGISAKVIPAMRDVLVKLVGDVPVEVKDELQHPSFLLDEGAYIKGLYYPDARKVELRRDLLNDPSSVIHEAGHAAMYDGTEMKPELKASVRSIMDEIGAVDDKHPLSYAMTSEHEFLAEAISNPKVQEFLKDTPVSDELATQLGMKPKATMWQALMEGIRKLLGFTPEQMSVLEPVFKLAAEAMKEGRKAREGDALASVEGPEPMKIKLPYAKGREIGMKQDVYNRHMKLIQKGYEEQLKADFDRELAKEKRAQTAEWKANSADIRNQVTEEFDQKPEVLVDRLLSEFSGQIKLDPTSIPPDLQAQLPKEYMRKINSISAEDLAPHFGYPSGEALVENLIQIAQERKETGLGHKDFIKQKIDAETDRIMTAQYGYLEKNYLEDAKERATSMNQIDVLHEDMIRTAELAGSELPIKREEIVPIWRDEFKKLPMDQIDSDLAHKSMGQAWKEYEDAATRGDWQEALKAKQAQFKAALQAKWALAAEKEANQLGKLVKKFTKTDVKELGDKVDPEYVNHIQDMIWRVGEGSGKRSWDNIKEAIADSRSDNFKDFVEGELVSSGGYRDLRVPDFMVDPRFKAELGKMPYEQFHLFKGAMDSLYENGRDLQTWDKQASNISLDAAKAQAIKQVETFDPMKNPIDPGVTRTLLANLTSMQTVFNRFDRGDRRGFFNKLGYRFAEADNVASKMEREAVKAWNALGDYGDLNKAIDAPPMITWPNRMGKFTRGNLLVMVQNMGNESNFVKMAEGLGAKGDNARAALRQWVYANKELTKDDWTRAQAMGDEIFNKLVTEGDKVNDRVNGFPIDKIPIKEFEVETAQGDKLKLKGWYHPLIPDANWYNEKQKLAGNAFNDTLFGHIMTSDGWTRSRTKAMYPLELSFEMLPGRMQQMIHDITHREVVLDAQKVLLDPKFLNTVTERYGKEYSNLFQPFLKDMAGKAVLDTPNLSRLDKTSNFLRQNTVSTYIGFNPSTVGKHAPTAFIMSLRAGGLDFIKANGQILIGAKEPTTGKSWVTFANEMSEELQRREQNWRETFGGQTLALNKDSTIREKISQAGAYVISKSDKASATPLWVGSYQRAIREGSNMREAIDLANADVRRQHGSTALSNKPELVRSGGFMHPWMVSVYGFMGERFQRILEMAHKANDMTKLVEQGQMDKAMGLWANVIADHAVYVAGFSAVEAAVYWGLTGQGKDKEDLALDALGLSVMKSIPYARDLYSAWEYGNSPSIGLLPSAATSTLQIPKDVAAMIDNVKHGRTFVSKQQAGKFVKDFVTGAGIVTGMAPKEIGDILEFGIDKYNRQTRARSVGDNIRGFATGKAPEDRRQRR